MTTPISPVISSTGIWVPNYAAIFSYFQTQYQAIYGADVYLGNDSQDGQFIGVLSQVFSDFCASLVAAYNAQSPATAQGAGLSSTVKINGLARLSPTNSTVGLTVTGVAGTTITNGVALDSNQNAWALPPVVTIPNSGSIVVTATAVQPGAITATANSITTIQTPVYGWQSVTNGSSLPVAGSSVETDAALRNRQSQSTTLPSQTIFAGVVASIEQLPGVTRAKGYENNTSSTDGNGIPANTLYFLVEGGTAAAIQNAIFSKSTPGIPTKGSISAVVTDSNGSTRTIKYDNPIPAAITANITLHGLTGWNTATEALIAAAIVAYIEAIPIGQNVSYTSLFIPAYLLGTAFTGTFNITAMTLAKNGGGASAADVTINYNEAATCNVGAVNFTIV